MNPNRNEPAEPTALERASRELLLASAEALDGRTRSRLTQARHAALAEIGRESARPFRVPGRGLPAGALAAAAVLAVAVWVARPVPSTPLAEAVTAEDAEMLASTEGPELYADDPDFYEWAGSDAALAPAAEGSAG